MRLRGVKALSLENSVAGQDFALFSRRPSGRSCIHGWRGANALPYYCRTLAIQPKIVSVLTGGLRRAPASSPETC
ncbi:MAG: hypothetical protein ACLS4Z_08965 [Christensenellaceae bacterium]